METSANQTSFFPTHLHILTPTDVTAAQSLATLFLTVLEGTE